MDSPHETASPAAQQIHALAAAAAAHGRSFIIAVSPAAVTAETVRLFRADPAAWRSAHVFLADTCFDACGCDLAAARGLLAELPLRRGRLHVDPADWECPVRGAAAYEQRLRAFFGLPVGDLPRFDAILLRAPGNGETGAPRESAGRMDEVMRIAMVVRGRAGAAPYVALTPAVIRHASAVFTGPEHVLAGA